LESKLLLTNFFTVETFGDQLNASGTSLRSKQVFTLLTNGTQFALKTHKGKFLTADHKEVKATGAGPGANEWFNFNWNNGVTYFQTADGKYLSASADGVISLAASVGANEEFEVHINYHPQICLQTQKRYLSVEKDQVVNSLFTQFGKETLLTLEGTGERGRYAIRGCNGKYFTVDGNGNVTATATTKGPAESFVFEFHQAQLAVKSIGSGKYLTPQGNGIKAIRPNVTPKEVFVLEDSDAQVTLKACINGKWLAFQGTNLISNKTTIEKDNIFMLQFNDAKKKWMFRTSSEFYIRVDGTGCVTVEGKVADDNSLFDIEYVGDGKIALKAANGKYLSAAKLGGIDCKAGEVGDQNKFLIYFFNRPQIVFLADQRSFVGIDKNGKVMSNRALPEAFTLEFNEGKYSIKSNDGKYLKTGADQSKLELSPTPEMFEIEFYLNKLSLKNSSGKYVKSENQGWLVATVAKPGETELFEF